LEGVFIKENSNKYLTGYCVVSYLDSGSKW